MNTSVRTALFVIAAGMAFAFSAPGFALFLAFAALANEVGDRWGLWT